MNNYKYNKSLSLPLGVDILRKVNCCKLKNELISPYKIYLICITLRCDDYSEI